jgi:hypothetical protein
VGLLEGSLRSMSGEACSFFHNHPIPIPSPLLL